MKKYLYFFLIGIVPMLFSCAKEMPVNDIDEKPIEEIDPWTPYPLTKVESAPGFRSITAEMGGETKTHFDVSGSYASVMWDAGDSFIMMGYDDSHWDSATYTKVGTESSVIASFSTSDGTIVYTANKLHSLYPDTAINTPSKVGGILHIPVTIPHTQAATIGSVAPGANIAYAQSDTQDEDLHFKNAVAIIKFTLSGAAVGSVTSVSFKGTSEVTGTFFLSTASSTPAYAAGYSLDGSLSATLSGSFTAEKEYYLAVAPSEHSGFMMTFTNSAGKVIKKTSSKSLTLNRGSITDFGTINIGDSFPETDPTVIKYKAASASAPKPVTIVVLPDGYQKTELDTYETLAKAGIDALFDTEPYNTYENYFNVYILKVASNESGANITNGSGVITTHKDCYFQSKWGPGYGDMSANSDRIFTFVENNCPDVVNGTVTMDKISILLIINDERYGGRCHSYSNGQNYCMVPTIPGGLAWSYPTKEAASVTATPWDCNSLSTESITAQKLRNTGTWHNILVHEFGGHAFGRLGDEYWGESSSLDSATPIAQQGWPVPMSLNLSNTSDEASVPWRELLDNKGGMITKNARYSRIDVFQGGGTSMFYRWRSERISCMIDNRFYFSTWQRRLIVNRIMELSGSSALSFAAFLDKDVMYDPVTDGSSTLLPDGLVSSVPPRPMPMLPPPVIHTDW